MMMGVKDIEAFLYREARFLDDREWGHWLDCYAPLAEFWMPAWTDDDVLTTNPKTEISLIYYPNKEGLEDRIFRIKTERSSASTPEPRTAHFISNVEIIEQYKSQVKVRFNWNTLSFRYNDVTQFFGSSFYTLDYAGKSPLITSKRVILKNDYIHQVLDVYHI